jgi:glycosyltransferase involved in cell wall biosynthesis
MLLGHFGSYGDSVATLLEERLPAIMDAKARPSLLLIGARSEAFRAALIARHPAWDARVHATGYVAPARLASYLEACDLFVQPYPDGITSRRTSAMACLSLGLPIVTTTGALTESLWEESGGVVLAPLSTPAGFASAVIKLIEDPAERSRVARCGLRTYRDHFNVGTVAATLRAASTAGLYPVDFKGAESH